MFWNPAVPPPPVAGAAMGKGVDGWLGVGEGVGVDDPLAGAFGDTLALLVGGVVLGVGVLGVGVLGVGVLGVGVPGVGVPGVGVPGVAVDCPVGVAVPVPVGEPPGENDVGIPEGVPEVQAETDADTTRAAHPIATNLPLSRFPAMAERIFMGPPHASAGA